MMNIQIGETTITPQVKRGELLSLGAVRVGRTALRNPANRFLPWIDSYAGDVFRTFRLVRVQRRGRRVTLVTRIISDPDYPLMERRDSSGDVCLRPQVWDEKPKEAELRIVFEPVEQTIDGRRFTGFKYWFEYASRDVAIHRLLDRQTWEVGGDLTDVNVVCRGLFDLPRKKVTRQGAFSTVGLDNWSGLLPGNLWGRWSLLPGFDMQYGRSGVLLAWFDKVSLIRTVIESTPGEDWMRHLDFHYFQEARRVRTNPKTVVWCPDRLDHTEALNLWTRLQDAEQAKACRQFHIRREEPPAIVFSENVWFNFEFDSTYNNMLEVAAEFGADIIFIDSCWENMETYARTLRQLAGTDGLKGSVLEKLVGSNMCCSLDFEVSKPAGGEAGLKRLCDRARAKGVRVISWMAMHYFPETYLATKPELGHGLGGIFAAKESGRSPDTGTYVCFTVNSNAPIMEKIRTQILGVCRRTGLAGYLWDSYSNMGWWQVDYSKGDMRPQFDKVARLYADLANAGLYIQPESVTTFSNHSCCGMHGGDIYAGDLLGYSYNTAISLAHPDGQHAEWPNPTDAMVTGRQPTAPLFHCFAHKRAPSFAFHHVPRAQWDPAAVARLKELFAVYRKVRDQMQRRTVLKHEAGVLWEGPDGQVMLWSFQDQNLSALAKAGLPPDLSLQSPTDVGTDRPVTDGRLAAERVYRFARSARKRS